MQRIFKHDGYKRKKLGLLKGPADSTKRCHGVYRMGLDCLRRRRETRTWENLEPKTCNPKLDAFVTSGLRLMSSGVGDLGLGLRLRAP